MSKHTPAPWNVVAARGEEGETLYLYVEPDTGDAPYRGSVCSVSDAENIEGITASERDANASLIAAAPDLLVALRIAERKLQYLHGFHTGDEAADIYATAAKARAAIAKATGSAA